MPASVNHLKSAERKLLEQGRGQTTERQAVWSFHNPVDVTFGAGCIARLGDLLAGRRYALATYAEPYFAELTDRIAGLAGPPVAVLDNIVPNPDFVSLATACARFDAATARPEVIVALGGGSVIDTAKAVAASDGDFARVQAFLERGEGPASLGATPIIALPTTAGTGSEVTAWATLWDTQAGKKHSLAHPSLYPTHALVDPELTLAAPRALTLATGLDALSHALESIWNINANPVSGNFAVAAASEILAVLPDLAADLGNRDLRARMSRAALMAGLAFSNTKTALAHSLSYPITLKHGVPHGLACSFSLPLVMRCAIGADPDCDQTLARIFGADLDAGAARLTAFLERLGVSPDPTAYGLADDEFAALIDQAFAGERGKNFIGRHERVDSAGGGSPLAHAG